MSKLPYSRIFSVTLTPQPPQHGGITLQRCSLPGGDSVTGEIL